jgi:hypothetical protein
MRASARATATVPRHLLEQKVEEATDTTVVVLEELATAPEDARPRHPAARAGTNRRGGLKSARVGVQRRLAAEVGVEHA